MEIYQKHNQTIDTNKPNSRIVGKSKTAIWTQIFLWFGLGVLLSGIIGFVFPWALSYMVSTVEMFETVYLYSIIGSAIVLFPIMIVFQVGAMKNKSILTAVCYVIYAIAFGILLSSSLYYAGAENSLYALLITGGAMAILGVAGILLKDKLGTIAIISISLATSALLISLVNFFFFNETIYWISSIAMMVCVLLIVAFDFGSISRSIDANIDMGNALIIYNAFKLYTDFLYIFVRILAIVASSRRK